MSTLEKKICVGELGVRVRHNGGSIKFPGRGWLEKVS